MSLDERLRSGLTEAVGRLSPVAESAAEPVLRRGQRLRWRGRAIAASSAVVVVGAVAVLVPQVWPVSTGPVQRPASIGPQEWEAASPSEPGCIYLGSFNAASELENADRVCGLFPPTSRAPDAAAFQMTAVDRTTAWLVVRDELEVESVLVIPEVPVFVGDPPRLVAGATTAPLPGEPGERPAQDFCIRRLDGPCELRREFRQLLPSGDYWEMWTLDTGQEVEELHTVDVGTWTLEVFGIPLGGPEGEPSAESIIRNLGWAEDPNRFLLLETRDQERAPLQLPEAHIRVVISRAMDGGIGRSAGRIVKGCVEEVEGSHPSLYTVYGPGLAYDGTTARWCVDAGYLIEIRAPDHETAIRLYDSITVVGSLDEDVELPGED